MGGLVVAQRLPLRTSSTNSTWTDAVRHVVCLGSPHLGADLEKGVNAASWALARSCRRPGGLADVSQHGAAAGVKDLRYGALLDEDWRDCDPDEFLQDRCHEVPFLPNAVYHFVSTTAAPRAIGLLVGDHLVRPKSASGRRADLARFRSSPPTG